ALLRNLGDGPSGIRGFSVSQGLCLCHATVVDGTGHNTRDLVIFPSTRSGTSRLISVLHPVYNKPNGESSICLMHRRRGMAARVQQFTLRQPRTGAAGGG